MILKTSFFNKGIYKSTVKRYSWGAFLYFVILFVSTGLSVFLNVEQHFSDMPQDYYREYPLILNGVYMSVPILLALVVPTVASLLVFRFVHSKKQAVFIHSLPVSRKANYISSILASFTLMLVPIIINTILLMFVSVSGYSQYFTLSDCILWMAYNTFGVFLMFSVATFSSMVTGNSFAMVGVNALVHAFLFIIVATLSVMADVFLYGFYNNSEIYDYLINNNFATVVFGFMDKYFRRNITMVQCIKYAVFAVAFYVGSYFIYSKRLIETAGDVAGFKCLNVIFKYLVTALATLFAFAVFADYIDENTFVFALIIALVSIIVYAACEMVLKKTVNVLYSWKGYVGFAVFFIALTLTFSNTSFFGYETFVPEIEQIEEAALYNYYHNDEPFTNREEIIKMVAATHKDFVSDIPEIEYDNLYNRPYDSRIHIKYNLKNGKTVYRVYPVTYEQKVDVMNKFYEDDEYKMTCEQVFVEPSKVTGITVHNYNQKGYRDEYEIENYTELLNAIKQDFLDMSYEQLYPYSLENEDIIYEISVQYLHDGGLDENGKIINYRNGIYINITKDYKQTVNWLESNGYKKRVYAQ